MQVLPKFHLELRWQTVEHNDGIALLKRAWFSGPALKDAAQIQANDRITLDFTSQHMLFIPDFYQAVLSWEQVEYKEDRVYLGQAKIQGKHINAIEPLRNEDWILISCEGHELKNYEGRKGRKLAPGVYVENYKHLLVYWAEVKKFDGAEKFEEDRK